MKNQPTQPTLHANMAAIAAFAAWVAPDATTAYASAYANGVAPALAQSAKGNHALLLDLIGMLPDQVKAPADGKPAGRRYLLSQYRGALVGIHAVSRAEGAAIGAAKKAGTDIKPMSAALVAKLESMAQDAGAALRQQESAAADIRKQEAETRKASVAAKKAAEEAEFIAIRAEHARMADAIRAHFGEDALASVLAGKGLPQAMPKKPTFSPARPSAPTTARIKKAA